MFPQDIIPETMFILEDDFFHLDTVKWASLDDSGTGTNTANDVSGGEVSIVTAAADNDYHVMSSTKKPFKLAARKPIWLTARFSVTEANTDDSNWIFGLSSVTTSGLLAADGAGPATTYDGITFYKVDGTMTIKFQTSAATAQVTQNVVAFTSGVVYRIGFHADPNDGTTALVTPFVYNESTGVRTVGTTHQLAMGSLGQMALLYGIKAGAGNAETLKVDYLRCAQVR